MKLTKESLWIPACIPLSGLFGAIVSGVFDLEWEGIVNLEIVWMGWTKVNLIVSIPLAVLTFVLFLSPAKRKGIKIMAFVFSLLSFLLGLISVPALLGI